MSEFEKTNWANPGFSQGYRDNADVFIVERRRMLAILRSFYAHFLKDGTPKKVLDLGCGDGIVTAALADTDPSIVPTLVDGSADMLDTAKEKLAGLRHAGFIRASFQELVHGQIPDGAFDMIASSLAIHHLTMDEKTALYRKIHEWLGPDGYFVNIDVVRAPTDGLEDWYLGLWKDWITERKNALGIPGDRFDNIIRQYQDAEENKPDTLEAQLEAMKTIGFRDVDCCYQYGIFTMFCGRK